MEKIQQIKKEKMLLQAAINGMMKGFEDRFPEVEFNFYTENTYRDTYKGSIKIKCEFKIEAKIK